MVPLNSEGIPLVPTYSGCRYVLNIYAYVALTRYGRLSQTLPLKLISKNLSYNPGVAVTTPVWALSGSLATTSEITVVFSSWGYLDVSVLPVRLPLLRNNQTSFGWVAPFGNPRINGYVPLPAAYRSLSRPSSPPRPKASPVRPFVAPFDNSRYSLTQFYLFSNLSMNSNYISITYATLKVLIP
jgi:hypothetical protein